MKFIDHYTDVPAQTVESDKVRGVSARRLLRVDDGTPNFAMRVFTVAPGGYTYHHSHPFEHENYVIRGKGKLVTEAGERQLQPGTVMLIAPGEIHQFRNDGDEVLEFICLVPNSYDK